MSSKPTTLGLQPSFGFGDRLGHATPGHIAALRQAGGSIKGIFAQQSIREMARTQRTATQVMRAAVDAIQYARFTEPWGADADHLKTPEDVRITAEAGFVFFTIDPSDYVDRKSDDYTPAVLEQRFSEISREIDWVDSYLGKDVKVLDGPRVVFDRLTVIRAAVKYGKAITHALHMGQCIRREAGERSQPFEIELSVDETDQPTSVAEHYIIADQLRRHGLPLVSLAPRFVGDFEKGVDYKGDLATLSASLADHAAIARLLGPYKLSLHSGSDKLSIYGMFAKATRGLFHVKTAGTSYMEALRVVAECKPDLFREIVKFARAHYDTDKATYHVSGTVDALPCPDEVSDNRKLQQIYLECWSDVPPGRGFTEPGRQFLHCTFGSVLTDAKLGPLVRQIIEEHQTVYNDILLEHFTRHLDALTAGMS
ncbi:MAG TPA: tagaturonate epimerase family protein [Pirellulales bacterium]